MTKSAKSILKKDVKKYQQLAEYTQEEENRYIYQRVADYIEEIVEEVTDDKRSFNKVIKRIQGK